MCIHMILPKEFLQLSLGSGKREVADIQPRTCSSASGSNLHLNSSIRQLAGKLDVDLELVDGTLRVRRECHINKGIRYRLAGVRISSQVHRVLA